MAQAENAPQVGGIRAVRHYGGWLVWIYTAAGMWSGGEWMSEGDYQSLLSRRRKGDDHGQSL